MRSRRRPMSRRRRAASRGPRRHPARPRRSRPRRCLGPPAGRSPTSALGPNEMPQTGSGRSCISSRRRARRSIRANRRPRRHGPAQRDLRAPCAGDRGGHGGRLSELRSLLSQRVFALEGRPFRSRALRGRQVQVGPLQPAGHCPRVLRDSFAHERLHPRLRSPVFRNHGRRGALPHQQCPARHLQRDCVERRDWHPNPSRSTIPPGGVAELDFTVR